ncbi:MAG: DUF438 domain-containing protein [Cyanobacteriota bacterium]|nr:DUF438 domain-containing protein [Cyanobacteriota bacterium]
MDKTDRLIELLERLNAGEDPSQVKEEAQEFLSTLEAQDLSFAEQKLLEAGLAPEDLRHLCSIHMEMLKDEVTKMTSQLEKGHPINTFVKEHEILSSFLDKLDKLNTELQKQNSYDENSTLYSQIAQTAQDLLDGEPHHQREEKVLFPAVEAHGVDGPTKVMVMEHEDLRRYKRSVLELANDVKNMNFTDFKNRINSAVKILVMALRDHIFKENNILYPTTVEIITDNNEWKELKDKCRKSGYCKFTPEEYK